MAAGEKEGTGRGLLQEKALEKPYLITDPVTRSGPEVGIVGEEGSPGCLIWLRTLTLQ